MDTFFPIFFFVVQISGVCYLAYVAFKCADNAHTARLKQLQAEMIRDIYERGFNEVCEVALAETKDAAEQIDKLRMENTMLKKQKAEVEARMKDDEEHHQHLHRQLDSIRLNGLRNEGVSESVSPSGKLKFKKRNRK